MDIRASTQKRDKPRRTNPKSRGTEKTVLIISYLT
jgi:hypothetical protein